MSLKARHVMEGAHVIVDGRRISAGLTRAKKRPSITFKSLPETGLHFLQIQNASGLFSNDFIFFVNEDGEVAEEAEE